MGRRTTISVKTSAGKANIGFALDKTLRLINQLEKKQKVDNKASP